MVRARKDQADLGLDAGGISAVAGAAVGLSKVAVRDLIDRDRDVPYFATVLGALGVS